MKTLAAFSTLTEFRLAFPHLGYQFSETAFCGLTHPARILDSPNNEYNLGCGLFVYYYPGAELRYHIVLK